MATLGGIAVKRVPFGKVIELTSAFVSESHGVEGDFRGRNSYGSKRQVTLLQPERWELACAEVGTKAPWTARRANLLVPGLPILGPDHVNCVLSIGDLRLQIMGETTPCIRMDLVAYGLRFALAEGWCGGVTCRVIHSGHVRLGDSVVLTPL